MKLLEEFRREDIEISSGPVSFLFSFFFWLSRALDSRYNIVCEAILLNCTLRIDGDRDNNFTR